MTTVANCRSLEDHRNSPAKHEINKTRNQLVTSFSDMHIGVHFTWFRPGMDRNHVSCFQLNKRL